MASTEILKMRIVSVDNYMSYPVNSLDLGYSEFRGSEIKTVPVLRIFGADENGVKVCANIHGAFPYLYVPCPETDEKVISQMSYQLAINLDKAINISLGQTQSNTLHVFKVSIVKGCPFYGFHKADHQFFKIYLYNPQLIRRAAGFLQNGLILGRIFQPHEAHIPYILKFFIDYNLYGMSWLFVPKHNVLVRNNETNPKKRAVSEVEFDFNAVHILNRFLNQEQNSSKAANPGIESIWEDERVRRRSMQSENVPSMEPPLSQPRLNVYPTESEVFYKTLLASKVIKTMDETLNATANTTNLTLTTEDEKPMKSIKKFNLKPLIENAAYAAECIENSSEESSQDFLNASQVQDHQSDPYSVATQPFETPEIDLDYSQSIEEMENAILNYTECNPNSEERDDEVLPSQGLLQKIFNQSQLSFEEKLNKTAFKDEVDSDDELFNDFNVTIPNMEIFSECVGNQEDNIPQFDGLQDGFDEKKKDNTTPPSSESEIDPSLSDLAKKYDKERNFYPEAGPSHRPPKEIQEPSDSQDSLANDLIRVANFIATDRNSDFEDIKSDDDMNIKSFYNNTILDLSSPETPSLKYIKKNDEEFIKIYPQSDPPDPSTVLENMSKFGIPRMVHRKAFYSNPADVSKRKEVGNHVLQLHSNKLNDCEPFRSVIFKGDKGQLEHYREEKLKEHMGLDDHFFKNPKQVLELLSTQKSVRIFPFVDPPTSHEARTWLKACKIRDKLKFDSIKTNIEEESPIKIKREKILMVFKDEKIEDGSEIPASDDEVINSSYDENLNCDSPSALNFSITRLTSHEKAYLKQSPVDDTQIPENASPFSYVRRRQITKSKRSLTRKFNTIMKNRLMDQLRADSPLFPSSPNDSMEIDEEASDSQKSSISHQSNQSEVSDESVRKVLESNTFNRAADSNESVLGCDITGPSLDNTCGFKMKLESLQATKAAIEHHFLTVLSVELHVNTRKELRPDPDIDGISAIFYSVENDVPKNHAMPEVLRGIIAISPSFPLKFIKSGVDIVLVSNEMELLQIFLGVIGKYDPDIFAGYEIEMASWGYLIHRGNVLGMNLMNKISRIPSTKNDKVPVNPPEDEDVNDPGDYFSTVKIPGRILLDVWRLLKNEIALTSYTFESIMYHIMHQRYPKFSFSQLTGNWSDPQRLWIVLDYYMDRVDGLVAVLRQLDLVGRTCELAKLFGIQFFEVLSRGSQYRVESMMIRIAKPRNYVPVSPSVQQRAHMRAPEFLPLILEPQSRFYVDPVIVLDFQSLYPSIIIAYNYCFSTCLGRVEHLGHTTPFEFGASHLKVSPTMLKKLLDEDLVTISPCSAAFVKSSVREGVLPRMLKEILDTRLMVKQSMKIHKNDTALQRVLHSRQLGLKLIANVTYGYTAANFSGRMPCSEVGDSVVSKGRETLERAIRMVEANKEWACKVVYGDTDSLFVQVPGRSREEAFRIGEEIVAKVTDENPEPIKLKLEKVYQPCILQTKKRYVGFMYETASCKTPVYEAKGIETVRRDGCPAAAKILEKSLRILFETQDVSKVKEYVTRQFSKILVGRSNIQDLIFAKEFRGVNGYKERACVPALELTKRWKLLDHRAEPRRGERVPFVIVNGAPGLPLIRLVRSPDEVLSDDSYKINSTYYITKVIIPPLNRCFLLLGVDVREWFAELPRKQQFVAFMTNVLADGKKGTISQYFSTTSCVIECGNQCTNGVCSACRSKPQRTVTILADKIFHLERKRFQTQKICDSCCRRSFETNCTSLDCPVLYVLNRVKREYKQTEVYREILNEF